MKPHEQPRARPLASAPIWLPASLALLLGLGIGRFAYTPLLPSFVEQGWLSEAGAAYVGAANLLGYLGGALIARRLAANPRRIAILNGAMAGTVIALFACALPLGFWWLLAWRLLAGVVGAAIMVLGPSTVLARAPPEARARLSGLIFMGVGIGIILSGTLLPALASFGLSITWATLGVVGLALAALAWPLWPRGPAPPAPPPAPVTGRLALVLIVVAYGSDGAGFVPHTLFLSDFVARGLGRGEVAGGFYWALFGVGAVVGAPLCGLVAGRIGLRTAFVGALGVKSLAVALPLVATTPTALAISALVVGALTPGMVALAAGLTTLLATGPAQARLFGTMTIAFALAQAAGGYGMSYLFAARGSHDVLFAVGAGVLALGAICAALGGRRVG